MRYRGVLALALAGTSCAKVPLVDVAAQFDIADFSWFAEEQTLFVFYDATAEQGIGEPTVIEVTYTTDDGVVDWTPLHELPQVHTHVPVDCGVKSRCGSGSLHVEKEPRNLGIRLRYHRDGELALVADAAYNAIGPGPAHTNRSFVVYGVFDATNRRIQWRGRHRFPTIRNQDATMLGLRREFTVDDQRYGALPPNPPGNPYGYGQTCPDDFVASGVAAVTTDERAVFTTSDLPIDAEDDAVVCAQATVTDARGAFTTGAVALKNPEVRPAFPLLRSPVRDATPLKFYLRPCDTEISSEHETMQRQRLELEDVPVTCTDAWASAGFTDQLVAAFEAAVAAARPAGDDMVLVIGIQQDEPRVSLKVQEALARIVPNERTQNSPRLAGAFVFDSDGRGIRVDALYGTTLWCPNVQPGPAPPIPAPLDPTCTVAADTLDLDLGPFSFSLLPILPPREAYLDFIDQYSVAQAGRMTDLRYRVPEFAASAEHIPLGDFGTVTFLNGEQISADADDAFSYCDEASGPWIAFRSAGTAAWSEDQGSDMEFQTIDVLPAWHDAVRESDYELGLIWDFPFLLRAEYEFSVAGAVSSFGLSVPFGRATEGESYLGTALWDAEAIPLDQVLLQCTRFCEHPTFDSARIYHPDEIFRSAYAEACYEPAPPAVGDHGWPRDP